MTASLRQFGQPLRGASLRAIWVSLLASSIGDWAAKLALAILVLDRTRSPTLSAVVVAVSFVPWVGPGQVLATRTGHLRRIPVMVTADLVRGAIYAVLLLHLPTAGILALAFAASLATPPFEAARSALTVEVVPEAEYGGAIALLDLTDQSAMVLGYLTGGVFVALGGYRLALLVDVASYLVSAAVLSRVKESRGRQEPERSSTQLRRGVSIVWNDWAIRRGTAVILIAGLAVGAVAATAASYARLTLHEGATVAGGLAAVVSVGMIVSIPLLPRSGGPRYLLKAAALAIFVGGLVSAAGFGGGHLVGGLVGFFGAGVFTAAVTPAQVAFQPLIPGADRPGVFSVLQGVAMGTQATGAALGGLAATILGPRHGDLVWAGVALAGSAVLLAVPGRRRADDDVETSKRRTPAHRRTRHRHRRRTPAALTGQPAVEQPAPETT